MQKAGLGVLLVLVMQANAQTATEKIENTGKRINNTINTIGGLKGLFGKKGKTADSTGMVQQAAPGKGKMPIAKAILSPVVKGIDASEIYPFIGGKAIVTKGNSYGVIDTAGNFIIPYNRYSRIKYVGTALLCVSNGKQEAFLDNEGKILLDFNTPYTKTDFRADGFVFARVASERGFSLVDAQGNWYKITENKLAGGKYLEFVKVSGRAIIMKDQATGKFGFKNLRDQLVGAPVYDFVSDFYNGHAVFAQKDNYGTQRYGIIDTNGIVTASPVFSNAPEYLGGEYFRVAAANDADFYYAIIKASGAILMKEPKGSKSVQYFTYYEDGFFYSSTECIMDTAGNRMTQRELLVKAGLTLTENGFAGFVRLKKEDYLGFSTWDFSKSDGFLVFTYFPDNQTARRLGLLDVKSGRILLGPFEEITDGYNYFFDPVSGLAIVRQDSGVANKGAGYGTIMNVGYMNKTGLISLLRAEQKTGW